VLSQKMTATQWLLVIVLSAIGFITWQIAEESWFFWLILVVVAGKGIKVKNLAWISLVVTSLLFVLIVLSAQYGLIVNEVYSRAGVTRYAMGFNHPNIFGLYLLIICLSFSIIRFGKNPLPDLILLAAAAIVNLSVADSRTSAVLAVVQGVLLLTFYLVKTPHAQDVARKALIALIVLIFCFSYLGMIFYDSSNATMVAINQILSNRPSLAHAYFEMAGIPFLGDNYLTYPPIYWSNGHSSLFVVDNAYCHLLLRYGLIAAFVFYVGYCLLLKNILKEKHWNALFFGLVVMAIYGTSETFGIKLEANYFLIVGMASVLFGTSSLKDVDTSQNKKKLKLGSGA
jgi:hypothetical protein